MIVLGTSTADYWNMCINQWTLCDLYMRQLHAIETFLSHERGPTHPVFSVMSADINSCGMQDLCLCDFSILALLATCAYDLLCNYVLCVQKDCNPLPTTYSVQFTLKEQTVQNTPKIVRL